MSSKKLSLDWKIVDCAARSWCAVFRARTELSVETQERPSSVAHTMFFAKYALKSCFQHLKATLRGTFGYSVPHAYDSIKWSQNVGAGGPHHRYLELIVSSSFNQPMAVERGRSHELVGVYGGGRQLPRSGITDSIHISEWERDHVVNTVETIYVIKVVG